MKNDVLINNFKKLSSVILFPIPRYIYVPNMRTLSQTMPWELSYLGRLVWNLYMFIDDRNFYERFSGKFVKNQVYHFSYQLVHMRGLHAKGFLFLRFSSFSSSFLKKWSKWRAWIFVEMGRIFRNYRWFCEIITTCVP